VREMDAPPLFISGPKCCSIDTKEYADALTAARYPCGQAKARAQLSGRLMVPALRWLLAVLLVSPKASSVCCCSEMLVRSAR
jgi:hypothetical protein